MDLRGYDPAELHARSALFRSMPAGRRVLVVLDNAADVDQVRPLLPGTPGCLAPAATWSASPPVKEYTACPWTFWRPMRRCTCCGALSAPTAWTQAHNLARCCGHLPLALRIAADRTVSDPHLPLANPQPVGRHRL